ncbi:MAG TPA: hypothetical protein VKB88_38010 [Bryobacteraceae bacterium]|nr:hypothetical protein [Bryobacteraceae bacterium]
MDERTEQALYAAVRSAREAYTSVNAEFDAILARAHSFPHGSAPMVDALSRANALAPELQEALGRYFEAARRLREFYRGTQIADKAG